MKNHHIGYCALASTLLLASCQEDFKDEVQPTISITAPAAGQKIWLDAPLTVDAADEQGVSKVAFYLNDELVGEDVEAPYELMLNTKEYEDGTYILRTVAYDGAGNQTGVEREIEVFNMLLKVEVAEDRYEVDNVPQEWIIISDAEGNTLQTEGLKNGVTSVFTRPEGFTSDQLTVTLADIRYSESDSYYSSAVMKTYHNISPGEWLLEGPVYVEDKTIVGDAFVEFTSYGTDFFSFAANSPDGSDYMNFNSFGDSTKIEYNLYLHRDPARVYVAADFSEGKTPRYALLNDVQADGRYTLTARDFMPMKLVKTIDVPSSSNYASMFIKGYYTAEKKGFNVASSSTIEGGGELPVYQPEGVFNGFDYFLFVRNSNFGYSRTDVDNLPNNYGIPQTVSAVVASTNRNGFSASVSYPSDYARAYWSWSDYSSGGTFSYVEWSTYGSNQDNILLTAPELPKVISDLYPSLKERVADLSYSRLELVNVDNITSFEEYATKLYQPTASPSLKQTEETVTVYPKDTKNGRIAKEQSKLPKHIQDALNFR